MKKIESETSEAIENIYVVLSLRFPYPEALHGLVAATDSQNWGTLGSKGTYNISEWTCPTRRQN